MSTHAQAIPTTASFAWGENIGYLNFAPAGTSSLETPVFFPSFARGFVWGENVGWINLGRSPRNTFSYTNDMSPTATDPDAGVNIALDGTLSGFAWGENIGWINFNTAGKLTADGRDATARIDYADGRLRGYAWAENVGWINLDDDDLAVNLQCLVDVNGDRVVNGADFNAFLLAFNNGDPIADQNRDGVLNGADFNQWLGYFAFNQCSIATGP